jgi:hypothetical protein
MRVGAAICRPLISELSLNCTVGTGDTCSHLDVTLRFSPTFGSSPVNFALANSKAVTIALAGPSHNSAVEGSIRNKHTSGSFGPPAATAHRLSPGRLCLVSIAQDAGAGR